MRQVLARSLEELMQKDERIVVLNADLARPNGLQVLHEKFPDRTFNVGIAEQNMACVAAGLSSYGLIPFISTFTAFASRRICDQIAISGAYARQNIKILATDPGLAAEFNGGTHMSVEDVGVLRSIPGVTIFEPTDPWQLKKGLPEVARRPGVIYVRTFRKKITDVFSEDFEFSLLKAAKIREGKDLSIFCSGIMVQEVLAANARLEKMGIDAEIINVHTLKPIDVETIVNSARKTRAVLTAENHNVLGGLSSAVSETLAHHCPTPVESIGIRDKFGQVGDLQFLKETYGMTAGDIIRAAQVVLARKAT